MYTWTGVRFMLPIATGYLRINIHVNMPCQKECHAVSIRLNTVARSSSSICNTHNFHSDLLLTRTMQKNKHESTQNASYSSFLNQTLWCDHLFVLSLTDDSNDGHNIGIVCGQSYR